MQDTAVGTSGGVVTKSPENDAKTVQVVQRQHYLAKVEPCPGLREPSVLPLQEGRGRRIEF